MNVIARLDFELAYFEATVQRFSHYALKRHKRHFPLLYIYIYKLVNRIRGRPKAPFSIATTTKCRGGHYSFPCIAPLTLDPYRIMPSVKLKASSTIVWFFGMTIWDWTQVSRIIGEPLCQWVYLKTTELSFIMIVCFFANFIASFFVSAFNQ